VLNDLFSTVCNAHESVGISSKKTILLTSTIETSQLTVKAFEESADGSAFIFFR